MEETDHLNPDGSIAKQTRTVGAASQGALMIDDANKRLTFFGGAAVIHGVTEAELKAQKDYAREDSLLGYRVIVQRSCETSGTCTEYWIAPDLGSDDVKVDLVNGDHRATKQAASITLGEPSFEIPDYPRDVSPRLANPAKP